MLYNGDCLDLLHQIPDRSIDLILVDEPFGSTSNPWDTMIDQAQVWAHKLRLIRQGGAIIHFAADRFGAMLVMAHAKGYKHRWIWNKAQSGNFAVAKHQPLSVYEELKIFTSAGEPIAVGNTEFDTVEDVIVFTAKGEKVNYRPRMRTGKMRIRGSINSQNHGRGFGGMKQVYYQSDQYYPTNILNFPAVSRRNSLHPSEKPVELLAYLIETYSLPGATVLDYCMGSGSCGEAAIMSGRNFIGIEKDQEIFRIASRRIGAVTSPNSACSLTSGDHGEISVESSQQSLFEAASVARIPLATEADHSATTHMPPQVQ